MKIASDWKDYEILDMANGEKLERWNDIVLVRPDPQIIWNQKSLLSLHYPFVKKDPQKRTCAKALVMTHAYSNAIIDKVEEAVKNGIIGNEDDDW